MTTVVVIGMPSTASADDPVSVSFTLEGCREPGPSYNPDAGDLVCADSEYTPGNLGKDWDELDLVPYRLTATAGKSAPTSQTYTVVVAGEFTDNGTPGYDFITEPKLNPALSDASCVLAVEGPQTASLGGGVDEHIYYELTITQAAGDTCVIDYTQRLAVGSHLFPGSSLHSNLFNEDLTSAGIGEKKVPLPVNQISPQELSKTMTATRGADHVWNVVKGATPAELHFNDTCSTDTGSRTAGVAITVSWTRLPASPGDVTIVSNIYATNPSSRIITVNVTDKVYEGTTQTTQVGTTANSGDVNVPANTANYLVLTNTQTVASSATQFNDVATATYKDLLTGVPVPGSTQATATATVQTGSTTNSTATITDVESITGTGFSYSVDSFSGASGSFDGAYTAGTQTTGAVGWTSATQSGSGSVTFNKTVYVAGPMIGSGTLSDTAELTASNGFTADADLDVDLTADATVTLTINKTIPNVLQGAETATFVVKVYDATRTTVIETVTFTFTAGETEKSASVSLQPGTYDVVEETTPGWLPQNAFDDVNLNLPTCAATRTFNNDFGPATANVVKVTNPVGNQAGWEMCLLGPGTGPAPGECVTTGTGGQAVFTTVLQEGSYTVTETAKAGFDQTNADGCSFTVDYPADQGRLFTCTLTNTERGTVTVIKTSSGVAPPAGAFTFEIRSGASTTAPGTTLDSDTNDAAGNVDFDEVNPLLPGTYQVCETGMMPGWHSTLSDRTGAFVPGSALPDPDNSVVCVPFTLAPGEDEVFTVNNTPPPGGDARTIGFWRNWSSCTGGNQNDTLDETLDEAGGILIGDLTVDTCAEAVSILSKSALDGKKMASDAAYGLAAQLLAAFLNVEADAGTCEAATAAMLAGQALLDSIDFDGTGGYLGPKVKGGTLTLRNQALAYAATLDAYNNNELCP